MAIGQHICIRLTHDAALAPTVEQRRVVARVVLATARRNGLLAFGLADTHLHLEAGCSRTEAGELARRIEIGLYRRLGLGPFTPASSRPIEDIWHLHNTFRYVLRQPERHQLDADPLREASNLPDLLGLRVLGAYTSANVRSFLPRVKRRELLELAGVEELEPVDGPMEHLLEATLAACALPSLAGKTREAQEGRRALLEIARPRLRVVDVAALLGADERSIYRMLLRPASSPLVNAIRQQLHLIAQIRPLSPHEPFTPSPRTCAAANGPP